MAEDQDLLEELEAAETVEEKKSPIVKIILIVVGVLALAGGGYFAYTNFFQEKAVEAPAEGGKPAEGEVEEEAADLGVMFSLNPFIVNLADSGGKRFLKVTISLELSTQEVHAELKENLHKITDSILVLLSSKTFEDVYSVQGKFKLKDEIATRVNRFLIVGHVKDAYFTEFVIQ